MPGKVLSTNRDNAISAPVLPALTQAWTLPSRNNSSATRIDESGLPRKAWAGFSSMVMTSDAGVIDRRARSTAGWPAISSSRREG
ncbi:hypothetical protein D3C80_1744360 [compost metagenome]